MSTDSTLAVKHNQTLLFIGDSITDYARKERDVPLGCGYVRIIDDLAKIRHPAMRLKIINRGIGGHTVEDLRSRWQDHVIAHRPDWLIVKIGINDINRYVTNAQGNPEQSPARFEAIYREIIADTQRQLPDTNLLLLSCFYASSDRNAPNSYRARVLELTPRYVEITRQVAQEAGAGFLDLHARVQALIEHLPADEFAEDAVHPSTAGNLFLAECVYQALNHGQ